MSRQQTSATSCQHPTLVFEPSSHASKVGYRRATAGQRVTAAGIKSKEIPLTDVSYPAPLVLPNDDLALDPRSPPQSLRSWLRLDDRNEVTPGKNAVYVVAPPKVEDHVEFVNLWSRPQGGDAGNTNPEGSGSRSGLEDTPISSPRVQDVVDYVKAFYDPLPVKLLPNPLCFASWESSSKTSSNPRFIGLNNSADCVRIRTRASKDRVFRRQLNLDDLLDAAMSILPEDAYALLLMVQHDLYEDEEDEFVCGRAYGGSRVAVISAARYNPVLDLRQKVEREHAWPASHCGEYFQISCSAPSKPRPLKKKQMMAASLPIIPASQSNHFSSSPMHSAVSAHTKFFAPSLSPSQLSGLWLSRICRTATHELGHCFGLEHCVYFACVMQGSASLAEDVRQPPYLCPIDVAKLDFATGSVDTVVRNRALLAFCRRHEANSHFFAAFAAWLENRLEEL